MLLVIEQLLHPVLKSTVNAPSMFAPPHNKSWRRHWVGAWWGRPLLLKFWVNRPTRWIEIADFEPIFARSASAVTPSEKKFN